MEGMVCYRALQSACLHASEELHGQLIRDCSVAASRQIQEQNAQPGLRRGDGSSSSGLQEGV